MSYTNSGDTNVGTSVIPGILDISGKYTTNKMIVNSGSTFTSRLGSETNITQSFEAYAPLVIQGTLTVNGTLANTGLTTIGDGGVLKGDATITGATTIGSGGKQGPSNSPGTQIMDGATLTWASGGTFELQVYDATSGAGTGWDLVRLINNATLNITATSGSKFNIEIQGLSAIHPDVIGNPASNFNASTSYSWKFVDGAAGNITNFDVNKFNLTVTGFTGNASSVGRYSLSSVAEGGGTSLYMNYDGSAAAAPEPATMVSLGMGLVGFALRRFRTTRTMRRI